MELRLHHVGVLTGNVERTVNFYARMLGMQAAARIESEGGSSVFLKDGPGTYGLVLEVIGPPFLAWMEERFERHGPVRSHISFQVEDVDGWYRKVGTGNVDIVTAPQAWRGCKGFAFRDACGVVVQLFQFLEPLIPPLDQVRPSPAAGFNYNLHHVSIVTDELLSLERFYHEALGLQTILDLKEGGIVFMADPASVMERRRNTPSIEIIAPPGLWEREQEFLNRYGPGIDHVSFLVQDVDSAYEELRAKGASFHVTPTDFEGTRLAFFKDPDGLDIEIELPNLTHILAV
jgi:catechol 2,3-dioxygenase-like lactoylglutathione lyase family enzyme